MRTIRAGGRLFGLAELSADLETPVSAYLKIRQEPYGFLFESVEGGERQGRYSFLGSGPAALFTARGKVLEETRDGRTTRTAGDPLAILARRFGHPPRPVPGLPRFDGGLVGFVGYDAVRRTRASSCRITRTRSSSGWAPTRRLSLTNSVGVLPTSRLRP